MQRRDPADSLGHQTAPYSKAKAAKIKEEREFKQDLEAIQAANQTERSSTRGRTKRTASSSPDEAAPAEAPATKVSTDMLFGLPAHPALTCSCLCAEVLPLSRRLCGRTQRLTGTCYTLEPGLYDGSGFVTAEDWLERCAKVQG